MELLLILRLDCAMFVLCFGMFLLDMLVLRLVEDEHL